MIVVGLHALPPCAQLILTARLQAAPANLKKRTSESR
jgi:hypothetical protein